MCSFRTLTRALIACFVLLMFTGAAFAQGTHTVLPGPWPFAGLCYTSQPTDDAFHIVFDGVGFPCSIPDAALRLTLGGITDAPIFGQLGVVDTAHEYTTLLNRGWFSKFAPMDATVLRSSEGDLVLSATTFIGTPAYGPEPPTSTSIRFGTTPYPNTDTIIHPNDIERMTLWGNGKLAVGTQGMPDSVIYGDNLVRGENDFFHLHLPCLPTNYTVDPSSGYDTSQLMSLKLSYGLITSPQLRFAQLGFDRGHQLAGFGNDEDLVLSTNSDIPDGPTGTGRGDIVITNRRIGRAIRFGTTYDSDAYPNADTDQERLTIAANGNVGIDLPKDSATGLMKPLDQVQIGGGSVAPPGYSTPIPGLTLSGGNRFEGMLLPSGKIAPVDRRYIGFNYYIDHSDTGATRFHRFQPMASSRIEFSQDNGGLLSFKTEPYDASRGLNSFSQELTLETSVYGLGYWVWDSAAAVQTHKLFEVNPPGITLGAITRNPNGLAFFHTPVCITSDTASFPSIDFQNLPVHPDMGDGLTWDLVVNGPALFKEAWVNSSDWPDYVLQPNYHLMSIEEFGNFMARNHHLPEIPPATKMTTISLGKTDADLTKQMEEMALYIVQLNKDVTALKAEVQDLKKGGK